MVLIQSYQRTGSRSWNIGGEKVNLKPFRRASMQVEKPKPPEPENRRKSAEFTVKLIPDSPLIIEAGPPIKPKPEKKTAKWQSKSVDVSFTFVIGGYKAYE